MRFPAPTVLQGTRHCAVEKATKSFDISPSLLRISGWVPRLKPKQPGTDCSFTRGNALDKTNPLPPLALSSSFGPQDSVKSRSWHSQTQRSTSHQANPPATARLPPPTLHLTRNCDLKTPESPLGPKKPLPNLQATRRRPLLHPTYNPAKSKRRMGNRYTKR